jgi:hypothetical protein
MDEAMGEILHICFADEAVPTRTHTCDMNCG